MAKEELKSCPFCAHQDNSIWEHYGEEREGRPDNGFYVFCGAPCGGRGPVRGDRQEAIDGWNKKK